MVITPVTSNNNKIINPLLYKEWYQLNFSRLNRLLIIAKPSSGGTGIRLKTANTTFIDIISIMIVVMIP